MINVNVINERSQMSLHARLLNTLTTVPVYTYLGGDIPAQSWELFNVNVELNSTVTLTLAKSLIKVGIYRYCSKSI